MRGMLGLFVVAAWVGCAPSVRTCADQTLFVTVTLDAATRQADRLIVDVSLDGGAARQTTLDHEPGRGSGGVQIEFPGGYPVGKTLTVTLSCDHRVFDGAVGAQYLGALKELLEKPALLLV